MAKSWNEVKAVLDDPAVSPEKKQALLQSWTNSSEEAWPDDDAKRDEIGKYQEAYNAYPYAGGPGYGQPGVYGSEKRTDELYDEAKKEGSANTYNEREHQKTVDAGRTGLDSAQPPTTGGGGTKTSDELLKQGEAALKVFEDFGPLLGKIPDDCRGRTRPLDINADIKKRYNEQKGIDFAEFLTDSSDFTTAAGQVRQALKDTRGQLDGLSDSWTGPAADKANEHYNEKINTPGDELVGFLEGSAAATSTAVDVVYRLVKGKVDAVIDMYTTQVGKADLDMATSVVNLANGSAAGKDEMEKVAGWMDINFGTNMREKLNDDGCCDDDDIKNEGIRLAKQWIQNQFNVEMWDGLWTKFDKLCTDTKDFVDDAYSELTTVMGKAENEFANAAKENPPPPPPKKNDNGGGGDTGGGGGGTGGGGTGGGGTGSGGGGTGGGGTPGAVEPPATDDKGTNPITGKPLETDPETGKPYPIDPETGEAIKDAGDDDTMTVKQGDNEIKMSEPGKDGKMDISIDDGTPPAKDYKLDFGNGEVGADGKPVEGAGAGADGEQVYKPGPDGKIVIEDNGVKITAEQPQGPKGPTVVTVDDGKGEPVTYTLGADNKPGGKDALNGLDDTDPTGGAGKPDQLGSAIGGGGGAVKGDDGFSAPGDLDLPGDVETKPAADGGAGGSGSGAGGGGAGGDSGGSGGSGGSAGAVSGSAGGDLGNTGSLSAGAQVGAASPEPAAAAGLGSAPGGAGVGAAAPAAAGAAGGAGGMGMMGGMGAMGGAGGGGGQSGDQERQSSQYRVAGNIFETSGAGGRISGSLDEEGDRSIRYDR
ncbi:WXG100 family type VII secretion target [Amycolatopsis magusensis]|uniref:WXG100 family type VII secretion target n=1 Tax=Amycolatopsis magusensis TaxID=882444 RepID=UPI003C2FCFAB